MPSGPAPDSAVANFNMGLVKAEKNEPGEGEKYLKKPIEADPRMAQAVYNLCIISSKDRLNEAVGWRRCCFAPASRAPRSSSRLWR
jgi:hypothetical protein